MSPLPRKTCTSHVLPSLLLHTAHYFPQDRKTMDDTLSAASILASVGDVNHWTIAHFFVELYTSTDNTAKPVNVDLVKWLHNNNTGSRETETGSIVSDKVKLFRIFRLIAFFRFLRIKGNVLFCQPRVAFFSNMSNKSECLVLPNSCCMFFEYIELILYCCNDPQLRRNFRQIWWDCRLCLFFDFFEINRFNAHLNYMLFILGRKAVFWEWFRSQGHH